MQTKELTRKPEEVISEKSSGKKQPLYFHILKAALSVFVLSVLLGICTLAMSVLPCDLNLVKILIFDIRILSLNVLPILGIVTILYFITNRLWISFLTGGTLSFIIAEINRFKLYFRDDSFIFKDILLFEEAGKMLESYDLFLDKISAAVIVFIIALTVVSFFIKTKKMNKTVRISGAVISCLLLLTSYNLFYYDNPAIYKAMWHDEFGTHYKPSNNTMSRGVVYSFLKSIPEAFPKPPYGYNEEEVLDILSEYKDTPIPEDKKVNVLSVMFEAYNDLSVFEGVEIGEVDPYANFHALQNDGYSGNLFTSIFAGDTIKTERAFITGFGGSDFTNKIDSYATYFKSQGYYTEAMHPGHGWFYNRRNINEYIGFDNFEYYENKFRSIDTDSLREPKYNGIISDTDFFDYIMEGYENATQNGGKYFNFSVTYQNHGPYSTKNISDTDYIVKKDEYNEADYNIINNYLTGIYRTDRAIGRLREFVDGKDEPVVLILFGDHNPLLGEGNTGFEMLGINLDIDNADGAKNYYQTPYVIYANEAAKKALGKDFKGTGNTVSPMFLMNEFFEYAGLEGSKYLNYLSDVKKEYNVINPVWLKSGDEFILRGDATELDIIRERQCVEHYLIRKK